MIQRQIWPFMCGIASAALLFAAVAQVNPGLRCLNERGGVWIGPVSRCYPVDQVFPASTFERAR